MLWGIVWEEVGIEMENMVKKWLQWSIGDGMVASL